MTLHGHRFSNGGLTDSQLPLDVQGGSLNLGYLRRVRIAHNPGTRGKKIHPGPLCGHEWLWSLQVSDQPPARTSTLPRESQDPNSFFIPKINPIHLPYS